MKVLLVNSVCGIGSTGKICIDIANALQENGHECIIAYGRGQAKGWNNTYKISSSFGNKLHYLKSRIFDKHGLGSAFATKKFIKFIKSYNPDVIHLHNIHGYYLNYKILFKFLQKYEGKVVWTVHDMWLTTGHCACYLNCTKWQEGCHNCSKLKEYPVALFDNSFKNYKLKKELFTSVPNLTLIPVSSWIEGELKKSFLKDVKSVVINNGINLKLFSPCESEFRNRFNLKDEKILLAVADRWNERKGYFDLLKLAEMLGDDARLVIVGLTKEQKESLPERIIGITRTENQKQLVEIYSSADLFVNFTYSDNFPTVNIESIACGTPVLTYRTGGSPEILTEETGFVVEQGDIAAALKIIKTFEKTDKMKNACIAHAKKYDKANSFNKYLKVYMGK